MHNISLFLIGMILVLSSCGDTEIEVKSFRDLDIISGIQFYNNSGAKIGKWQNPNNKPLNVQVFPNPSNGNINVIGFNAFKRIWLIPAECIKDTISIDIFDQSQSLNYSIEELEALQIKDISLASISGGIQLDFSDVNPGFYRVFFQMPSEELFWENLFINPGSDLQSSIESLDSFCQ